MNLGQLRAELKGLGIKQIGVLKRIIAENGKPYVTIYFSADEKVVFPHRLKTVHPLVLSTDDDGQKVNIEQVRALKRSLIPDWDE